MYIKFISFGALKIWYAFYMSKMEDEWVILVYTYKWQIFCVYMGETRIKNFLLKQYVDSIYETEDETVSSFV